MASVYHVNIHENSAVALLARVKDDQGNLIDAQDIDSITYEVWDRGSGEQVGSGTLDADLCVYDSLQTDSRWTVDDEGFNFIVRLDGDHFPEGNKTYRVEVLITPFPDPYDDGGGGDPYYVKWDCSTIETYSE